MVLAAGRGERMRPLTDRTPKPLLEVRGKPLLQYHLEALRAGGIGDVVVNTAWLGEQVEARFGSEPWPGLRLHYSHEGLDFGGALETAGGIARALPRLDDCFWLIAGDVWMPGFALSQARLARFAETGRQAHVFLVANPPHHPAGDFGLAADGTALGKAASVRFTYSTAGLFRRSFFASLPEGNPEGVKAALGPMLYDAIARGEVTAELHAGAWVDVGTPERLAALNAG